MVEEQLKLDMLIAKLSSISRIFCALTNIRNRDLRSNVSESVLYYFAYLFHGSFVCLFSVSYSALSMLATHPS